MVDEHTIDVRLWSRLPAVAERLWSPAELVDVGDFYRRLQPVLQMPVLDIDAIQTLRLSALGLDPVQIGIAKLLEPVKWYARLLGEDALRARLMGSEMPQARPYDANSALTALSTTLRRKA